MGIGNQINDLAARAAAGATAAGGPPAGNPQLAAAYGRIYSIFNPATDILPSVKDITSATCWDDPDGFLTDFYQPVSPEIDYSSSLYYWNVYQNSTDAASGSNPQFAIAYGNFNGLGGATGLTAGYTGLLTDRTPTKAVYSQYANILLAPGDNKFTINGVDADDILVINFYRSRYKEKLDPGNWELALGAAGYTLIDDSGASGVTGNITPAGRVFNVMSGSILNGTASGATPLGLCYPDVGIIILDAQEAATFGGFAIDDTSTGIDDANILEFFTAISDGGSFQARTEENISSTYYFVRVGNMDFNYTNNDTFTTGSLGLIRYSLFHTDPRTYITAVGLYNDNNELLAVAKLSKPLLKSFTREALIRVKVDF